MTGCFYREFTKLAASVSCFVLVASAVATVGPGALYPLTTGCAPPFSVYSECFFGATRNDNTKFSRLFAKLLATNYFT